MRKIQTETDLQDILNGACIYGSGGGGPWSVGNALISTIVKAGGLDLAEPKEVADAAEMAVAAGVGSPDAAASDPGAFAEIPKLAFDALAKIRQVKFDYVLPGEVGAGNSFVPMAVAATSKPKIPMIDGSGAGRAIPSLTMCTFASHDVPISPVVLANQEHQVSFTTDSAADAEGPMRAIISDPQFGQDAGIAFWGMDGKTMKSTVVAGTLSQAWKLGATLREALKNGKDPVTAVTDFMNGWVLVRGKFKGIQEETRGGFDFGYLIIEADDGSHARIYNQNENLIAWSSTRTEPLAMAPDLICYLAVDGTTFSNADTDRIKPDQEIVVIGAKCSPELRDPRIVNEFVAALRTLGYAGKHAWIETLMKRRQEPSMV